MDEDNSEKKRPETEFESVVEPVDPLRVHDANRERIVAAAEPAAYSGPSFTNPAKGGEPGIAWVRASDLLYSGSGRIAGRGLDLETVLSRRVRQTPAVTRRAIRERADRLPPLSEFGVSSAHPQFTRSGPGLK
jgi:hypothetical protein